MAGFESTPDNAVEAPKGSVRSYRCNSCEAYYDAEAEHDFEHNEHWWIGKLRNPDFWDFRNESFLEGISGSAQREAAGMRKYLGRYRFEKIEPRST